MGSTWVLSPPTPLLPNFPHDRTSLMRTLASSALRALFITPKTHPYSILALRCIGPSKRHFLASPRPSNQDDPTKGQEPHWNDTIEETPTSADTVSVHPGSEGAVDNGDGSQTPSKPRDLSGYGSAARRAGRHIKKPKEVPQLLLPPWFFERNVILREELPNCANVPPITSKGSEWEPASREEKPPTKTTDSEKTRNPEVLNENPSKAELETEGGENFYRIRSPVRTYEINKDILREISLLVCTGLQSSPTQTSETWTSSKADLLLYHPKNGGSFFLDELVAHLAAANEADLVYLEPQDIAEIGGSYIDECRDTHVKSLSSLGYDAYPQVFMRASFEDARDTEEGLEEDDSGDYEEDENRSQPRSRQFHAPSIGIIPVAQFGGSLMDIVQSVVTANPAPPNGGKASQHMKLFGQLADTATDLRMSSFIESILNANEKKRETNRMGGKIKPALGDSENVTVLDSQELVVNGAADSKESINVKPWTANLIVVVRDYTEINTTSAGEKVLHKLHEIVRGRRKDGQRVIVIGTSSSEDFIRESSKAALEKVQSEPEAGPIRTILTPCRTLRSQDLSEDHKLRVALINLRNIQDMLRRLSSGSRVMDVLSVQALQSELKKQSASEKTSNKLGKTVWPLDLVHHIATVALGVSRENEVVHVKHVSQAVSILTRSELAKYEWLREEQAEERNKIKSPVQSSGSFQQASAGRSVRNSEDRIKKLRRTCNAHEKRLLNGVVDPESIRTTFADVRAPPETIDALKSLTSLSLLRPEAFTYGVLATDKIPGLLLYGPPGTGKSLLARAVAKESGATVLEVSGADVYDMYVGEGEKNVKAIFSLAKKLSPCIVFIDEADAILGSRGTSSSRTTHREMINQFLREWDGMGEASAFIMVATNRPFDLDEASLRRLPRRLLVDLPTEEDREAILKIHLKDEILDPEVSLTNLATQTPFYSGSDLKNVAVAAALSCVREEVENTASQPTSSTAEEVNPISPTEADSRNPPSPNVQLEKRILAPRHFTDALEEISASISDDMSSLVAIRKFDEKFGDRRGRRKKMSGYGFKTVEEGERKLSDRARVRN